MLLQPHCWATPTGALLLRAHATPSSAVLPLNCRMPVKPSVPASAQPGSDMSSGLMARWCAGVTENGPPGWAPVYHCTAGHGRGEKVWDNTRWKGE